MLRVLLEHMLLKCVRACTRFLPATWVVDEVEKLDVLVFCVFFLMFSSYDYLWFSFLFPFVHVYVG